MSDIPSPGPERTRALPLVFRDGEALVPSLALATVLAVRRARGDAVRFLPLGGGYIKREGDRRRRETWEVPAGDDLAPGLYVVRVYCSGGSAARWFQRGPGADAPIMTWADWEYGF